MWKLKCILQVCVMLVDLELYNLILYFKIYIQCFKISRTLKLIQQKHRSFDNEDNVLENGLKKIDLFSQFFPFLNTQIKESHIW